MIRNILKIIWNNWKAYFGILVEQTVVFTILMLCVVSVGMAIKRYHEPGVLDTESTVCFGYMVSKMDSETKKAKTMIHTVVDNLEKLSYVEAVTWSMGTIPYMRPNALYDSVRIDGKAIRVNFKGSDKAAEKVFNPEIVEGEWLTGDVLEDGSRSCVVTQQLVDDLGWSQAVGRKIIFQDMNFTIVGVLAGIKHDAFEASDPTMVIDMGNGFRNDWFCELCARVTPGREKDFVLAYYKEFNRLLPASGIQAFATEVRQAKKQNMSETTINLYLQAIPTLFLLIFAFIGTFGLFLQHMGVREHEFAVRLSVGSTKWKLLALVVVESVIVTIFACLPGLVLSLFIYDCTGVEITGIAVTLGVMLLFSVLSAWFPARKVIKINPAIVLK